MASEEIEWHGWSLAGDTEALHVGRLPGRSSVALYKVTDDEIEILAYFRSEERAIEFKDWVDRMVDLVNGRRSTQR